MINGSADNAALAAAVLVLITLGGGLPRAAVAQGTTADDAIEEIQVTATRRPAATGDVSAAVTLIAADDIRAQKLTTDALASQPGVFLQQTTPGQGAPIIRGLKGSEVLHLVDGLRMNNAIFRNAPTQYLALVSPATVDRIELLRGSPASLYGSDAVGGVVHVINRVPVFDQAESSYRGETGAAFDTAEQQRSGFVTLEAGNERIAGLVSANYLDTGNRRIGGGSRVSPTGYSARSFRAALSLTPNESESWLIDLQHGVQPKTPRIDELVPGFGETAAASDEFFFAPNERSFLHLRHARTDGWFGADWTVDAGWQRIVDDRISRASGSNNRRLEDNSSDLFGLSMTAAGEHARGSWVAGFEAYHDEVSSRRREIDILSGSGSDVQSRFPDGSTVQQASVYANADYDVGRRQSVNGGLRYTRVSVDLAATNLSGAAQVEPDDISADIGWRLAVTEEAQVIANLSYGFRAPNVFDLGTLGERPGNRFNIPNAGLASERINQFDAGFRYARDGLRAELVAWRIDYNDRITSVLTGDITADGREIVQTQNRASAELWGIEGLLQLPLGEGISGELIVNYVRGEQDDADGRAEPADRVPPLNGRVSLRFDIPAHWHIEPSLRFAASQDRLSDRDSRDPRIDPTGTDGWVTANLRAGWLPEARWSVWLAVENLFDERYRVHGSGLDAPGRNFSIDLRYRF